MIIFHETGMRYDALKILMIGSKRDGALELSYKSAFCSLGLKTVDHIDPEDAVIPFFQNRVVYRLAKAALYSLVGKMVASHLKSRNDYDFIIVFKGAFLSTSALMHAKKLSPNSIWVNINPDDPFNIATPGSTNNHIVNSIPIFDIYAIWNKNLIGRLGAGGCRKVIYLPFGYNSDLHYPAESKDESLRNVISFVGCWDKNREQILTKLADFPLAIFGDFWDRVSPRSPLLPFIHPYNIYGARLRSVMSSSRASINILRPQNYGAHNMRTFEIPAMGGLMITTKSNEQESFFPSFRASLSYSNADDLRYMLRIISTNEVFSESIRHEGYSLREGHSYVDRARYLLSMISQ